MMNFESKRGRGGLAASAPLRDALLFSVVASLHQSDRISYQLMQSRISPIILITEVPPTAGHLLLLLTRSGT